MITCLALTHRGMEDLLAKELTNTEAKNITLDEECVLFSTTDLSSLCAIIYQLRTATGALQLLTTDNPEKAIANIDFNMLVDKTFAVQGENAATLGGLIKDKTGATVNLTNPDIIFTTHSTSKKKYFGIDICGTDLGKRDYRIFLGPTSIKGSLAYGLCLLAGWKKGKSLLDPFCQSGVIPIEAALAARNKPISFHTKKKLACNNFINTDVFTNIDKNILPEENFHIYAFDPHFKHISATQKNAKIAQVNKCITYSRQDTDWVDLKLGKETIDCIITTTPPPRDLKKNDLHSLFKRAKALMRKNSIFVILTQNKQEEIKTAAKEWILQEQRTIWQGQAALDVFIYVP